MKKNTNIYHFIGRCFLVCFMLLGFNLVIHAQKAFTQRTSTKASQPHTGKSIYNLRGDFEMMGNTNLVAASYNDSDTNNSKTMSYVDADDDAATVNSSAAYLNILDDACTKVVYAGLYWSGRAQTSSSTLNDQYTVQQNNIPTGLGPNADQTISHNGNYGLAITRESVGSGGNTTYYPRYQFDLDGTIVQIDFTNNNGVNRVQYRIGSSGIFTNVPGSYSNNNNTGTFSITPLGSTNPLRFNINGKIYEVKSLIRDSRTSRSESNYQSTGSITLNAPTITTINKTFDKREVKLKIEGDNYMDVTAADADILYPYNDNDYIYAGYADVTDYVRQKGAGNYYVADIALKTGSGGGTGYSGGWGMIVIYENPNMKWRDITIFDGHAYVQANTSSVNKIDLSGFKAAQAGDVNVDMGFLAAEGENTLTGDYFRMRRADITSTTAPTNSNIGNSSNMNNPLSTAHGTSMLNYPYITTTPTTRQNTNFFNSSIYNGYGPTITLPNSTVVPSRTPHYTNNYGFDLAKIKLDNADKKFIKNSQTSTTFYYGTSGDTYVIYNVVFAVDAYVPEAEVFAKVTSPTGTAINNLQPNDEVTLTADIYNYGSDAITNGNLQITIPVGMQLVSAVAVPNTQGASGASVPFNFQNPTWISPTGSSSTGLPAAELGGVLEWKLGNVPTQTLVGGNKVPMATLTYKLKVTDNCLVLQTSAGSCVLELEIKGIVTGTGVNSGADLEQGFTTGYNTDCNNTAEYGSVNMKIIPSASSLSTCSENNPTENGVRMFKRFCTVMNNKILRAEIVGVAPNGYPAGTKFYAEAGGAEVASDFPVDPNGAIIYYRAVLPGAPTSCYLRLATQLDVITTTPIVTNVSACQEESIVFNNQPSNATYQLFYFQNQTDTTPMGTDPAPITAGVHTYWVAEGITNGTVICIGKTKVSFTITIHAAPAVLALSYLELCTFADYESTINSGGATVVWEYWTGTNWITVVNQLGGVSIVSDQLKITKAPVALNGTKFRVKLTNTNNCSSYSNEMTLAVKGCQMPANPMIYTPLKREP